MQSSVKKEKVSILHHIRTSDFRGRTKKDKKSWKTYRRTQYRQVKKGGDFGPPPIKGYNFGCTS